ncbi:MAG: hypothetical protein WC745_02025 [Patescibacteria group bacterium]|jgi:hypothetical protein
MSYKFAQITLSSKTGAKVWNDIFLSETDAEKEMRLGKLFILVEIKGNRNDSLKMINFLLTEIPKNYYQNEQYFFKESGLIKIDLLLESALTATNKSFSRFCRDERIRLPEKNSSLTVGVIHKDALYFSCAGTNKAFLAVRIKEKDAVQSKLINILNESRGSIPETESQKHLFSHIISGPFPRGARAIFTNETLPEYFSEKKLSEIITTLPPAGAAELIRNELSDISAITSILGLIIKNLKNEKISRESLLISPPNDPNASLSYLDKTEKQTETFLSPSGILPIKNWGVKIKEWIMAGSRKYFPKESKFILIREKIVSKKRTSRFSLKKPLIALAEFLVRFAGLSLRYFSKIKPGGSAGAVPSGFSGAEGATETRPRENQSRRKLSFNSLAGLPSRFFAVTRLTASGLKNWFTGLGRIGKILLIAGAACLVIFSVNLSLLAHKKKDQGIKENYSRLAEEVAQKQNQIEASFLYGNEKGAKDLIIEVAGLLDQIPADAGGDGARYEELKKKFREQEEKLSHAVKIADPKILADFSIAVSGADPSTLAMAGEKIFAYDRASAKLFKIDKKNKAATSLVVPAEFTSLSAPVTDKNNDCLYKSGNKIAAFDPAAEKWTGRELGSDRAAGLNIFSTYNNRLYFLDIAGGQIVRFNKSGDNYSAGQNWLTETADFKEALDLDIDGNVYILNRNGEVQKFFSGKKADFSLEKLIHPLSGPTALKVSSAETGYIYISEPKEKRLAVYKKDGSFVLQYQSEKFDNFKDFIVDESAKKIYILNGATVYEIEAEHLK